MVNHVPGWWWWEQMSSKSGWSGKSGLRLGPGLCIGQWWRREKCGTGEVDESGGKIFAQVLGWRSEWGGLLMHCVSKLGCKAAAELLVVAGRALQKCNAFVEALVNGGIKEIERVFLMSLRCWITLQVVFWGNGQVCKEIWSNFAAVDFQWCSNLILTTSARRRKRLLGARCQSSCSKLSFVLSVASPPWGWTGCQHDPLHFLGPAWASLPRI